MYCPASSIVAFVLASATVISASPISSFMKRDFHCDVNKVQCCDQTMTAADASKAFSGLLILDSLVGNVGLNCNPIGISAGSQCKSTPVCCSSIHQSGLINTGCSPLSVI